MPPYENAPGWGKVGRTHMTDKQPEALRLSDALTVQVEIGGGDLAELEDAAAELRRLHALNARLVRLLAFCVQPLEAQGMKNTATNVRAAISEAEAQQ